MYDASPVTGVVWLDVNRTGCHILSMPQRCWRLIHAKHLLDDFEDEPLSVRKSINWTLWRLNEPSLHQCPQDRSNHGAPVDLNASDPAKAWDQLVIDEAIKGACECKLTADMLMGVFRSLQGDQRMCFGFAGELGGESQIRLDCTTWAWLCWRLGHVGNQLSSFERKDFAGDGSVCEGSDGVIGAGRISISRTARKPKGSKRPAKNAARCRIRYSTSAASL